MWHSQAYWHIHMKTTELPENMLESQKYLYSHLYCVLAFDSQDLTSFQSELSVRFVSLLIRIPIQYI